jgi:hypothetical protein
MNGAPVEKGGIQTFTGGAGYAYRCGRGRAAGPAIQRRAPKFETGIDPPGIAPPPSAPDSAKPFED